MKIFFDGLNPSYRVNRQIAETITRGERAEKSLGNVDAHNSHFIGRTPNLRMLRENFVKPGHIGVVTAVNGVGGLGKTALAIEYAHAFADEYGGGRWQLRCAGKDDLRLALAELATPLGFEFTDDEKKIADLQFERTRRELKKLADAKEPHRCLLLLDNVDRPGLLDPAQVARLNGGDWLHVLATTRLGENELHGAHRDRSFLAIDELPSDDALALIESYQPDGRFRCEAEREAAREIVLLLGCFTLAVESAAVYLGQFANDVTCAAFLARLKKEGLEGLDIAADQSSAGVLHGEKRLGATLLPTLERLGPAEKLALEFAALLPPDQVPLPGLRVLVAKTFPEMARDTEPGYPDPWRNVLRHLFSLRLLQATDAMDADGQPRVVRVHRVIQDRLLYSMSPATWITCRMRMDTLVQDRVRDLKMSIDWTQVRWEIESLESLAWLWAESDGSPVTSPPVTNLHETKLSEMANESDDGCHPFADWLLDQTGRFWRNCAEWRRAERLLRMALEIDEQRFGPHAPFVALRLNSLALLMQDTGRFSEAETLYRRAMPIDEKNFGPDHPEVATDLNNLASLLYATNRLNEAEPLMRRALVIHEQHLGSRDPLVATDLNNLACLLRELNRLAEAEALHRRGLAIDEQSLGPEHLAVAKDLHNLSLLLMHTNRPVEAEPLARRVVDIFEKNLGSEHPNVATALNNLAGVLEATNHLGQAETLTRRALAIDEKSFGPKSHKVARDLNMLALLLNATNRLAEAEPLIRRALLIDEQCFGREHPNVAVRLSNLARLLHDTNRMAEAEPLFRRALAIDEQSFGPEHPEVADDFNNLAGWLNETERQAEAEPLFRRALAIDERSLGPEHPTLATRLNNLAGLLRATNRQAEAEPLMRRALAIREKALVPNHPDTLKSLDALAGLLEVTSRFEEAVPLRKRVLEARERSLGPEHPDMLKSWNQHSHALCKQGHAGLAEPIDRRVAATTAKLLGDIHPLAIHRRNNLVLTLIMLGKLEEARQILAANWRLNAPPHANTTPRIAFLRHLIALLESQPGTPFLGQLKTLLTGPELPVASDVAVPWDIAYFIEFLKPKLGEDNAKFLTSLVAALNDRTKVTDLDNFPQWHSQPPISLNTLWQDKPAEGP